MMTSGTTQAAHEEDNESTPSSDLTKDLHQIIIDKEIPLDLQVCLSWLFCSIFLDCPNNSKVDTEENTVAFNPQTTSIAEHGLPGSLSEGALPRAEEGSKSSSSPENKLLLTWSRLYTRRSH
jgi:hypothetical protein